ncbi:MAG: SMC-Scp complex subunit ScpB [Gammaproteobacteria bacterium RIFCSPHIGHO2_12_FULL_45_9]|nr:MAG: SMC-Scp complex subunit ScpB [Gammaproteobacteria bacterium RIFCSPHIGHO2_12_FULL_45_9]
MISTKALLEAALFATGEPLSDDRLYDLVNAEWGTEETPVPREEVRQALRELQAEYDARGVQLQLVASGYRFQTRPDIAGPLRRLWEKKPARYSRAVLETLALIAYRQPISRGEIEAIRGVTVASSILKQLQDREWVTIVGHREVPGRPALFGTTKVFLDYFNLRSLSDLPPLPEPTNLEQVDEVLQTLMPLAPAEAVAEGVPVVEVADGAIPAEAGIP